MAKRGRPPAGPDGQRVVDLHRISLHLPDDAMRVLKALAVLRGVPAWRVVTDLLNSQRDALEAVDTRALKQLLKARPRKRSPS